MNLPPPPLRGKVLIYPSAFFSFICWALCVAPLHGRRDAQDTQWRVREVALHAFGKIDAAELAKHASVHAASDTSALHTNM